MILVALTSHFNGMPSYTWKNLPYVCAIIQHQTKPHNTYSMFSEYTISRKHFSFKHLENIYAILTNPVLPLPISDL